MQKILCKSLTLRKIKTSHKLMLQHLGNLTIIHQSCIGNMEWMQTNPQDLLIYNHSIFRCKCKLKLGVKQPRCQRPEQTLLLQEFSANAADERLLLCDLLGTGCVPGLHPQLYFIATGSVEWKFSDSLKMKGVRYVSTNCVIISSQEAISSGFSCCTNCVIISSQDAISSGFSCCTASHKFLCSRISFIIVLQCLSSDLLQSDVFLSCDRILYLNFVIYLAALLFLHQKIVELFFKVSYHLISSLTM